jgi:hypothetical protein
MFRTRFSGGTGRMRLTTKKTIRAPALPGREFLPVLVAKLDARINVVQPAVAPGPEGSIVLSQKLPTVL